MKLSLHSVCSERLSDNFKYMLNLSLELLLSHKNNSDKWISDLDKVSIMKKRSQVEILRKRIF